VRLPPAHLALLLTALQHLLAIFIGISTPPWFDTIACIS